MRDIKFRAWNSNNSFMDDDFYIHNDGSVHEYAVSDYLSETKELTLMQFTGLKDKNSVGIYEGDILQYFPADYDEPSDDIYDVRWKGWGFEAVWHRKPDGVEVYTNGLDKCDKDMIVVGNIYENPELLK